MSKRAEFIEALNTAAGMYDVNQIGTRWHDVDTMEDEFTEEEGFTITVKKNKITYKKDFFGAECMKPIPKAVLKDDTDLTVEEFNAQRIMKAMGIK